MKPDMQNIRLTIAAAEQAAERLEKAIADYDHRAIGRELYNVRRELSYLKQLTADDAGKDRTGVSDA